MRKVILMNYCLEIIIFELLIIEINKKLFIILPIISKQKKDIKKNIINKFITNQSISKLRVFTKKIEKPIKFKNYKEITLFLKNNLNLINNKFVDLYEINLNQNYNIKKTFLNSGHFKVFFKKNNVQFLKIFKMIININDYINDKERENKIINYLININMFFIKLWKKILKKILPKSLFKDFFEELKILSKKKNFGKNAIIIDMFIDFLIASILIITLKIFFNTIIQNFLNKKIFPNLQKFTPTLPFLKILENFIKKSYLIIFLINYKLIMSFLADIIYLKIRFINFITKFYSNILNFVKIRARDYNLLLNDLSYSPKIKEIIFDNRTINKKLFIIPVLNAFIILYCILFLFSLPLKIIGLGFFLIWKAIRVLRDLLRDVNSEFFENIFNWYLKVCFFKLKERVEGFNVLVEI